MEVTLRFLRLHQLVEAKVAITDKMGTQAVPVAVVAVEMTHQILAVAQARLTKDTQAAMGGQPAMQVVAVVAEVRQP